MAAEPGAPLMGFICQIDGVMHLTGKCTDYISYYVIMILY